MPDEPSHGDLLAEIANLRACVERHHKDQGRRLDALEQTQADLVRTATQGKTGLKVLLWAGGATTTLAIAAASVASVFFGKH